MPHNDKMLFPNMQPKVTIILPVYNVEPYLRQCLYSVVNQTMRDIQIICVNDGSTDGSPAILEEYAAKDSRIEVIHQENQGGGSARNAAYPFIRGKYAYFADPDDWLELDLCQQCYDKAEETGAECVVFRDITHYPDPWHTPFLDSVLPEIRQTPEEKYGIFKWTWRCGAPWNKFWRSDFLLSNEFRFSDGKRPYNDMLHSWTGIVLAHRIAILDNPLYHYRVRRDSYQHTFNEKHFIVFETTINEIEKMLHATGCHNACKEHVFKNKLDTYSYQYSQLSPSLRSKLVEHIRRYWTESDRELLAQYLRSHPDETLHCFHSSWEICGWLEIQRLQGHIHQRDAEIHRLHTVEISQRDAEIQNTRNDLALLQQKRSIYWHYYRYKVLAKITLGKKRKHYKEKRNALREKVRQIRNLCKSN